MSTVPHRSLRHVASALVASFTIAFLAACGTTVAPRDGGGDASGSDAAVLPDTGRQFCTFPDGRRCDVGASCPAGDGCNSCTCQENGFLACTLIACTGPDSGMTACRTATDCPANMDCIYSTPGCATGIVGHCEPQLDCGRTRPFCGCDGETHLGACNGPDAPFMALGECTCGSTADCAAGFACVFSAGCAMPRGTCQRPTPCSETAPFCACDGTTYESCVPTQPFAREGACNIGSMVDCDPAHVSCRMIPPTCPMGQVPSVDSACWGSCVPFAMCNPIPCDPATAACPAQTRCDPASARCTL